MVAGLCALMPASAAAQQFVLVSKAADGTPGNATSRSGMISADSTWVAFASDATNLITGDTNSKWDVFLKNVQTQAIERVSVATDGTERTEDSGRDGLDVNQNGQIVVFSSSAALVAEDTNTCALGDDSTGPCPDIYVRDRGTNTTTRISVGAGGQADGRSRHPRISDDGRYVVFSSLATNLVAGDTNGVEDVFLHDRQTGTTTRVSVATGGAQVDAASFRPEISGNDASIAFISAAAGFSSEPDPVPCPSSNCPRAFVHDRVPGATFALRTTLPTDIVGRFGASASDVAIDAQGRYVAVTLLIHLDVDTARDNVVLYDRVQRQTVQGLGPALRSRGSNSASAALSGNGHVVMHSGAFFSQHITALEYSFGTFDRHTGLLEPVRQGQVPSQIFFDEPELSTDGRQTVFTTRQVRAGDDTNSFDDVYIFNRDVDNDQMVDAWETKWGLNPTDLGDAAADADGDGRTNLQEYLAGSHPKATQTGYLAEGSSNAFFTTRVAYLNTSETAANVVLRLLGSEGVNSATMATVPARTRVTFDLGLGHNVPSNEFSTIIESDQPFAADRTMTWDATGFGAHAETAIPSPATTWYLAEGATHGFFNLFYLVQNPNDTAARVTINYLRPAPLSVVTKTYDLPANSRKTIWVDDEGADLAETDVSGEIISDVPIVVERAMYFQAPGQTAFAAGHDGAGITTPANSWFLAEGATGTFFDTFVLIANPGTTDTTATVTYLLQDGTRFDKPYDVAARSRVTIGVDADDPRLAATTLGAIVQAPVPIIVERAMWWPNPVWYEGHLSAGSTTTGTEWALAEGEIGVNQATGGDTETFILIANTSGTDGTATITLFHEAPTPTTSQVTVDVQANTRLTIPVSMTFPAGDFGPSKRFGAIVRSSGIPIVVERAMYTTVNGLLWSAGTSAPAKKLQ